VTKRESEAPCGTVGRATSLGRAASDFLDGRQERLKALAANTGDDVLTGGCRVQARRIVSSRPFDYTVAALIVVNSLSIGIQMDWQSKNIGRELPLAFGVVNYIVNAAFFIELVMRLVGEGWYFAAYQNPNYGWNILDFFLVALSGIDAALEKSSNISAFRILRTFRLVRVLRVIRMLRFFSDLRVMVKGIVLSLKPLIFAMFLLTMIMFMFAIAIMQIVQDELAASSQLDEFVLEELFSHFGSMYITMLHLFMATTGGFSWKEGAVLLMEIHPALPLILCAYISFTMFCVLNIVTALFVETAGKICAIDEEQMFLAELEQRSQWINDIKKVFSKADLNG